MANEIKPNKAREILKHGTVRGTKITRKQEELFRSRAVGLPVKKKGK